MPEPAYIICCAFSADDPLSGAPSFLNIIEELQLPAGPITINISQDAAGKVPMPFALLRMVSTWMKSAEDDAETKFEIENRFLSSSGQDHILGQIEFSFGTNHFQRVISVAPVPPGLQQGILYAESRIRRAGEVEWTGRQRFPIRVQPLPIASGPAQEQPTPASTPAQPPGVNE
jgi:hypothetical protein